MFGLIVLAHKALTWSSERSDVDFTLKCNISDIKVWLWRGYGAPYTQRGDDAHWTT